MKKPTEANLHVCKGPPYGYAAGHSPVIELVFASNTSCVQPDKGMKVKDDIAHVLYPGFQTGSQLWRQYQPIC